MSLRDITILDLFYQYVVPSGHFIFWIFSTNMSSLRDVEMFASISTNMLSLRDILFFGFSLPICRPNGTLKCLLQSLPICCPYGTFYFLDFLYRYVVPMGRYNFEFILPICCPFGTFYFLDSLYRYVVPTGR